jgi:branched-chain amino acid transport system ATP-binding protein
VLRIDGIDVYYGDLQALWGVSMTIGDGQIAALVGSNGAGKSTLMKTISGLLKVRSGSIGFAGKRLDGLPPHAIVEAGVSMVPEGRRVFPQMTVLENLEMGASVHAARKARQETLNGIYDVFPVLRERARQRAGTLSGGEQQMLAIGRSLMSRPRALLIDEMSLGLSPLVVQELSRVIRKINKSTRLTVFVVEQDVQLALSMADQGYIIENGRILEGGEGRSLLASPRIKEAYLGAV